MDVNISFIRTQLEYAVEVLAGCIKSDIEKLEVHLFAAKIITVFKIIMLKEIYYIWKQVGNPWNTEF